MRWAGHVAQMETRNSYMIIIEKLECKRPLQRPGRGLEDIVKMDLKEKGCKFVDLILLAQYSVQWRNLMINTVMNLRVP
jgi:hypothetical protein